MFLAYSRCSSFFDIPYDMLLIAFVNFNNIKRGRSPAEFNWEVIYLLSFKRLNKRFDFIGLVPQEYFGILRIICRNVFNCHNIFAATNISVLRENIKQSAV